MRIILADHHRQALWALKTMLQEEAKFEIVGEAVDSENLLILTKKVTANLVLVDRKLPGCHIKDLMTNLHALVPRPTVIVMSSNPEDSRLVLQAGADAFVSKGDQPDWLLDALHQYANRNNE